MKPASPGLNTLMWSCSAYGWSCRYGEVEPVEAKVLGMSDDLGLDLPEDRGEHDGVAGRFRALQPKVNVTASRSLHRFRPAAE